MSKYIDYVGEIWAALFMAWMLVAIIVSIVDAIRAYRGKGNPRDMPLMMPLLLILHCIVFVPIASIVYVIGKVLTYVLMMPLYLLLGAIWVWHRIFGKPKTPTREKPLN